MSNIDSYNWTEIYGKAHLFQKADAISIKVGLVLVPLLFGCLGIPILIFMDPPISYWFGGSALVAGALLFLFILMYAKKAGAKKPYVLVGELIEVLKLGVVGIGEKGTWLKIAVSAAYELIPEGKGERVNEWDGTEVKRIFVLKYHEAEDEIRQVSGEMIFLCVPNGQVVGFAYNGKLADYRF
ncbi:MAG: hypothetical protein P8L78_18480 [Mariniblastus sp.]|nr:hypothetical protein [Mariniblastus sp.]MDG2183683.1 hypothetical protein [Mariniblastus sp.]